MNILGNAVKVTNQSLLVIAVTLLLGLFYSQAVVARYVQSDPVGLNGGPNTYIYANAKPFMYTDPLGLNPFAAFEMGKAGAAVGSVFGGPVGAAAGFITGAGVGYIAGMAVINAWGSVDQYSQEQWDMYRQCVEGVCEEQCADHLEECLEESPDAYNECKEEAESMFNQCEAMCELEYLNPTVH